MPTQEINASASKVQASDSKSQPVSPASKLSPEALAKHTRRLALDIAKQGGRVFPMRFIKDTSGKARKVPAVKGWPEKATGEHERIARFFARPGLGIGIATEASGWVVFDTDQKPGIDGDANLRTWLGDHAHYLDETETIQTPSGSKHYRFTGDPVKSSSSILAPGVDVKSRGGYVVGEGSVTPAGGVYRVTANGGTRLPLPQPIIDLIANAYTAAKPRMAADVPGDDPTDIAAARDYLAEAQDIDGYNNAMNLARKLSDFGITTSTAIALFDQEINPRLPHYPWERDELEKKMPEWYDGCENAFGADSVAVQFDVLPDDFSDLNSLAEAANDNDGKRDDDVLARCTLDLDAMSGMPVPELPWHVKDWVPGDDVTMFYGDGSVGKSLTMLQLAASSVLGRVWFGLPVRRGRVIYITAEDNAKVLHNRLASVASREGVSISELKAAGLEIVSLVGEDPELAVARDAERIKPTKLWRKLVARIDTFKPALVVLDTLSDVFSGNENVRSQARAFIHQLRAPASAHELALIVNAHPSRAGLDTGGINAASGSSGSTAWHNSVRSRLSMFRDDPNDTDSRVLTTKKVNNGPVGSTINLRWVNGVFEGGIKTAEAKGDDARQAEEMFLELLDAYAKSKRIVSDKPGRNYAPSVFADDKSRPHAVSKDRFKDAMNQLFAEDKIHVATVGTGTRVQRQLAAGPAPIADAA
ncbi:hypothetical protein EN868_11190 [Mesorhizobium sp. M2D.F.Ca.ET.225.01.1.1]|uniref:AAA family ATPase n=1 Tax=unclassified Mesorhizobium TaxID=325217 RepID=UPI000FD446C5|nr:MULTISPECIES: AAA family ATPase [unclassified Mesorhizobium]TGP59549.1 hypothetical protein EN869_014860 [Mesorhizobium sp. M2D.F.Ca.ET.226.01.1.1]TGP69184.1 hypothetical protein EN868_11190 [Mesorhizobium sp. M2D.F.Ca.ET.225.01.1.1]